MTAFLGLCKRNMKIYFGDRLSVFFSMMTPIIIFVLYLLFLKGSFLDGIREASVGLGALSATSLFMLPVLFLKTSSAASALMTLVSVCAGFVIGAYIPVSQFSSGIRTFCHLFPGSGVTVLLRQRLMEPLLEHIDSGIGGTDGGAFAQAIRDLFA